jgi:hypothetical protein
MMAISTPSRRHRQTALSDLRAIRHACLSNLERPQFLRRNQNENRASDTRTSQKIASNHHETGPFRPIDFINPLGDIGAAR